MNVYVFALLFMVCSLANSMPGDDGLPEAESAKRTAATTELSDDETGAAGPPRAKRSDHQSDKELCLQTINNFLDKETDITRDPRLEHQETTAGIPHDSRAEYLSVKTTALTTFIYMQRLEEIGAYDSGQGSRLYLRLERIFKPIPNSLLPVLPTLNGEIIEAKAEDIRALSERINKIYGAFESGLTRPSMPFLNRVDFTSGSGKSCYENNEIGPRLDRFLSFIETLLKEYKAIEDPEKKAQSQKHLKRLYEILHNFEDACVDRSLSALDDAEQTLQFMMDPIFLSPAKDLSEEQKNQKRHRLLHYSIERYKKHQLMVFLYSQFGDHDELRESYLINLLKVQKSLGLKGMIKELCYLENFKTPFERPFAEIMINIIDQMSVEGFLDFASGIQEIPDELRQWLYQKTVLDELDFDVTFYAKLDAWTADRDALISRISEKGTSDPYDKALYQCATQDREPMDAYETLLRQFVREQAKKDLVEMSFASDTPYYLENFTASELYEDFYPSAS